MGGNGSGYPVWKFAKTTVEQCLHLDAVWLAIKKHMGMRVTGDIAWTDRSTGVKMCGADLTLDLRYPYRPSARIGYIHKETGTLCRQELPLTPSEPFYGGLRWWFLCPLCSRRVRKLYLPMDGAHQFGCRHCHALSYDSSQCSHRWDRLFADIAKEVYAEASKDHVSRVSRGLLVRMRS